MFGGGTGGDPGTCPCPSHIPLGADNKDGDMDDDAVVNSKQAGTGCTGMARLPLPEIWPRDRRPPHIL